MVGCSSVESAATLSSLKPTDAAALRWLFDRFAAPAKWLSVNSSLEMVHYVRWAWQKSRLDRKVAAWLHECDEEQALGGAIGLPVLAWLFSAKLGRSNLDRIALLYHAEKVLPDRTREAARLDRRSPEICHSAILTATAPVVVLPITQKRPWRYYSAFTCSGRSRKSCHGWYAQVTAAAEAACVPESPSQICLTFKPSVFGRQLRGLRLHSGRVFINGSEGPLFEFDWEGEVSERPWARTHSFRMSGPKPRLTARQIVCQHLVHNMAVYQNHDQDEWVMMGGLEGALFASPPTGACPCTSREPSISSTDHSLPP